MATELAPLTRQQKFFLVFVVPILFLVGMEILCRLVNLPKRLLPVRDRMVLEMPTWMQNDSNAVQRATRVSVNPAETDWLSLFEVGNGYRVRLIPNVERSVSNTFSQIPFDKTQKYYIRSNTLGFRGPDPATPSNDSPFRVVIFGDSSSFGWGVNQDQMFSSLLEAQLKKETSRPVEVLNFAIPGDSSEYGRLLFDTFIEKYPPSLLILGFGANDAKMVLVPHVDEVSRFNSKHSLLKLLAFAKESSMVQSIEALLHRISSSKTQDQSLTLKKVAVPKRRYQENLQYMSEKGKALGAKNVLLLNLCTPGNYAKRARGLAKRANLLYLNGQQYLIDRLPEIQTGDLKGDLVSTMRSNYPNELLKDPLFYITSDSCHPNALGHELVAEKIVEIIKASSLL